MELQAMRGRAVRRLFTGLILCVPVLSGCLVIPLNKETVCQEVVGQRINDENSVSESIVRKTVHRNVYAVLAPCGMGKSYFAYYEYYSKQGERLRSLPFLTGLWDYSDTIEHPIVQIEGTKKWLAIKRHTIQSSKRADNLFIVFDDRKVYHELLVRNCYRINAGRPEEKCDVEYTDGNRNAVIHTRDGDYRLDTVNGILSKI
jgi:hypothetical protein